ncbi:hypothetical protein [Ureibacillus chungkukjangi]|uniref:Uncharacterized protein n=1 Tax=Ureibacillus chungkukjangi TaxID=1202712 RepID=A0A318U1Q9_9BACL|nr:hypothetical protein [Ureibacillus chungkukjangi]MCM3388573.1 hypothetical protein [Ureibacillus chungkukjangi]PYF05889.1 hypothetical protein BJ095_11468 [Ureibacillus chungkukjangi]
MSKPQTRIKETKITQVILLGIFCFSIVVALLDSISIQPNVTSIYFYLLLLMVIATVYKPIRLFLAKSVSFIFKTLFSSIKSLCTTAISFILHK